MINSKHDWNLSPAYDLLNVTIVNPQDTEELALTLEGKKRKLKLEYFERFGAGLGLNKKQIQNVFQRFLKFKPIAIAWVDKSFLSDENKAAYKTLLEERYNRLQGN